MLKRHNPGSVAAPASAYSQGVEVPAGARWLHVSGQVGVRPDGTIARDAAGQVDQAFENLLAVLASAGMSARDVVKLTAFVVRPEDVGAYRQARDRHLMGHRAASTLVVVAALASPDWLVEVEAVAAKG